MGACCWGLASWECHHHGPGWQAFNTEASRPPPPEAKSCGPSGLLSLPAAPPALQRVSSGEPPFPLPSVCCRRYHTCSAVCLEK